MDELKAEIDKELAKIVIYDDIKARSQVQEIQIVNKKNSQGMYKSYVYKMTNDRVYSF